MFDFFLIGWSTLSAAALHRPKLKAKNTHAVLGAIWGFRQLFSVQLSMCQISPLA